MSLYKDSMDMMKAGGDDGKARTLAILALAQAIMRLTEAVLRVAGRM